jgi:hypothetical protein
MGVSTDRIAMLFSEKNTEDVISPMLSSNVITPMILSSG